MLSAGLFIVVRTSFLVAVMASFDNNSAWKAIAVVPQILL
jgi:hypothetical protein